MGGKRIASRVTTNVDAFKTMVHESDSIAELARKLEYKPSGGIYQFLNKKIDELGLSTSHMRGAIWNKGLTKKTDPRLYQNATNQRRAWDELFCEGSSCKNQYLLKLLVDEGKRKYECAGCGINEWQSQPITLQLHHINGVNNDNREDNLSILCPNCHSQTTNHSIGTRGCTPTAERQC